MKLTALPVIVSSAGLLGATPVHDANFPSRPPSVSLHYAIGKLTDYTMGNQSGGLTIVASGKPQSFIIAFPNKINGRHYLCAVLPSVIRPHPDEGLCNQVPSRVVVGKTRVRVTFWHGTFENHPSEISDEIQTLP